MEPYYPYRIVRMVPYSEYPIQTRAQTPLPYLTNYPNSPINPNPCNYCYNYNYNNYNYNFQVFYQIANPPNNYNPNMQNFPPVRKQIAYHPPNRQIVRKANGLGSNSKYKIIRPLKKGGFGQVFLVLDTHINK